METRKLLKILIFVLSLPHILLSRICEVADFFGIQRDIRKCLDVVDSSGDGLCSDFVRLLVIAEDHRSAIHHGVDPIAMARAIYVRLWKGERQGASTIEQQFVRVVTNRFEKTLFRKIREQLIAVSISRRRRKKKIAEAYLSIAFYGTGLVGIEGIKILVDSELCNLTRKNVIEILSRLKYPQPLCPSKAWKLKITRRNTYIEERENKIYNIKNDKYLSTTDLLYRIVQEK